VPRRTHAVPAGQQKVTLWSRLRRTHTWPGDGQQLCRPASVVTTWPGGQHAPLMQTLPCGQHAPGVPQMGWPGGQAWQTPLTHTWPLGQQALPQMKLPGPHAVWQTPLTHTWPLGQQALPQTKVPGPHG